MPISPEESEGEEEEANEASTTAAAAASASASGVGGTGRGKQGPTHFYLPVLQRTVERRRPADGLEGVVEGDEEGNYGGCYFAKALE